MTKSPLVSIITVALNNRVFIEDCLASVLSQTYKDIEFIVIDGGSTDGTVEAINKYKDRLSKFIIEKDQGLYYALNKGISLATGEIIGFLHSDDIYSEKNVIEKVVAAFIKYGTDSVYGNLDYVSQKNIDKTVRCWKSSPYSENLIRKGWMLPHPTFFVKKQVYQRLGAFNTDFRIAADYELILRLLYRHKISSHFLDETLIKMRWGGVSNKGIFNLFKKSTEDYKACKLYGLGFLTVVMKNMIKIPQFFVQDKEKT